MRTGCIARGENEDRRYTPRKSNYKVSKMTLARYSFLGLTIGDFTEVCRALK